MAVKDKKYYWLKLKRDFFKRHDIQIIEDMPNGKDYILFYLKLLCESVDHDGNLRFNDEIPYNEQMLATITRTNVDIVRSAVKVFSQLQMIDILDDGTYYMREVQKMLGSETYWAERKRLQKQQQLQLDGVGNIPTSPSKSIEQELDKDKNIDKDLDIEEKKKKSIKKTASRFSPPSLDDVKAYCLERNNNVDAERFIDYYTANGWKVGKNSMKDWKAAVRTWEKTSDPKPAPKQNGGVMREHEKMSAIINGGVF